MKNDTLYHAINCRIPIDTYEKLQEIITITQKNTAITVADAIVHYVDCVTGNDDTLKSLQIDQFAWKLNKTNDNNKRK